MPSDWLSTLHHDGSAKYVSSHALRVGDAVRLRLRVRVGAPIRRVFVRTVTDGRQLFTPMAAGAAEPPVQWYEAELPIRRVFTLYRFVVESDDGVWSYTAGGVTPYSPLDHTDFRLVVGERPPAWMSGAVMYQVFVDRFANGDPSRDPRPEDYDGEGYPYREHEYAGGRPRTFAWEAAPEPGQPFPLVFYGGDLDGIVERLDHLQELGVDALVLSPVFTSPSSHRFDVADHGHVDPRVGGDAALVRLREALAARGLRYLLELDARQVGGAHPWFRAKLADPGSPEAGFFWGPEMGDHDFWIGPKAERRLDYRNPELVRRMLTGDDAVLRHWLRPPFAADGWMLHLPQSAEMPGGPGDVGRLARQVTREARRDTCLMSRSFVDASARLQGDQLDGIAELGSFTFPLWHWLRGYREQELDVRGSSGAAWATEALEAAWRTARAAVPWTSVMHGAVMVGDHDVKRIRSVVGGSEALHRLAVVIQFTYPGIPVIYYGDEIGLEDHPQLEQRACMPWDRSRWNRDLLAFYRSLIALRRSSEPLRQGGFQVLAVEPDTLMYQREGLTGRAVVVAHRGDRPRPARLTPVDACGIADGTVFEEHFSGQRAVVAAGMLPLPELPQGGTIWLAREVEAAPRRPRRSAAPAAPNERRCPNCGRLDGTRLEANLTARGPGEKRRWVCLWCGTIWKGG